MIETKIKNNAVSAYMFMAFFFLLPSQNKYIKNDFVQSHSKTALLIHLKLFFIYIIFIAFGFLSDISIFGFRLNHIITEISFLILILLLIIGVSKASKGLYFNLFSLKSEIKKIGDKEILEDFGEEKKIKYLLSFIPFIGILIGKEDIFKFPSRISSLIGFLFILLFISGKSNSISILSLFYIIMISVFGVIIFSKGKPDLNDEILPNSKELSLLFRACIKYILRTISKKEFVSFKETYISVLENRRNLEIQNIEKIKNLENSKLKNYISYIPFIGICSLAFLNTKTKYHAINSIIINLTLILVLILPINNLFVLLLLFPIFYGISNQEKDFYKLPFLGDLADLPGMIKDKINYIKEKNNIENTFSSKK